MPVLTKRKQQSEDRRKHGQDDGDRRWPCFWSRIVITASARTCASMSVRISSILWLSSSRSMSVRARLALASAKFPASSSGQQPPVFFAEIATKVAVHALDPVVDPAEPGVVGSGGGIVDDRIDQGTRGLRFLIDFRSLRLIDFLPLRKNAASSGGDCILRDHHPAQRQCLLQRADIHPRQMPIRLDVFAAELVELMGNLARHHRRQRRRDRHQEDQADGDAEDSLPDGRSQHGRVF